MGLDVRVDARAVLRTLEDVPKFVRKDVKARFRTLGQSLKNELKTKIPKRTGRAQRAIFSRFDRVRDQNDIAILVGGNVAKAPHLATLESGATIKPKRAKMLTVPVGRAANKHGVARFSAKELKENPQAFGFASTWIRNDVILGETLGGKVEALFALRKSIVFPRRSIVKNFRRSNEGRIRREVEAAVAVGIENAKRGVSSEAA